MLLLSKPLAMDLLSRLKIGPRQLVRSAIHLHVAAQMMSVREDSPIASVVIPTFNSAHLLVETLESLAARAHLPHSWDVIVVDNNSTDHTRAVVTERTHSFPVPLRYVFERAQGRSHALNAGIAASTAPILVFTDADVVVESSWLAAAVEPLMDGAIDYVGGRVRPIWGGQRPDWLPLDRSDLWGTVAILDYGPEPFIFEERRRVPLGANMAVRRSLLERIGTFDGRLGRSGTKLLGQEVPEFLARARAAGARGLYVPAMAVNHHVPAWRLTKHYFRRWWYGKGRSRAVLDRLQPIDELGVDLAGARRLAGVPLFMFRAALNDLIGCVTMHSDPAERFRHQVMLWYFAGYVTALRARA
jgi:glycosyltransferase involved in cell wall biosynthesis